MSDSIQAPSDSISTKVESFLLEENISVHTKSDRTGTAVDAAPIFKVRSDMAECFCCGSDYKSTVISQKNLHILHADFTVDFTPVH